MMSYFNETFFGLLFHRSLRRFKVFQYAEEKDDFSPLDRYLIGHKTRIRTEKLDHAPQTNKSEDVEEPPLTLDNLDDPYLVDFYGPEDEANPQNWPAAKKGLFLIQLMLLTTSVYMASSIVAPAIPFFAEYFHIGQVTSTLGLTLFVLGYGVGPMIGLCAASEIPAIGRTIPYVLTLAIFVLLQIPTALVHGVAGYMILRFLAGLFGSPPLATGGASVQDVWSPMTAPLAMAMWGISASAGPVLGPLVGGYAAQGFSKTSLGVGAWRWTIWPVLILTGFTLILLILSMPETSASNILSRRAERLRKATGNPHLRSRGEIVAAHMTGKEVALMTFVRPFRLGLLEPIALSINLHIGLVYGVLYSFFESFTIVFHETYGFNMGENGLAYLGILVAQFLVFCVYSLWFLKYFRPKFVANEGRLAPEIWLQPAMVGAFCLPLSLFFFGWTSNANIHWMVPIVGTMIFSPGIFGLFASSLQYLAICYEDYIASVFSANDFLRATIGAAMPLVSRQLFNNLNRGPKQFPVAWGCTLLGCISLLMAGIPYLLYIYGPRLRSLSKYARDPLSGEKSSVQSSTSAKVSEAT